MKKKYFLRGMGIGIIITALMFSLVLFLTNQSNAMSDREIMAKAAELGMVMPEEKKTISDSSNESDENGSTTVETLTGDDVEPTRDDTEDEIGNEPRPNSTTNSTTTNKSINKTESSNDNKTEESNESSVNINGANNVNFVIKQGQDSYAVGENLKKAGIVDDASKFNLYLEQNGYDKKLKAGSFKIRQGSDYKTIAEALTK